MISSIHLLLTLALALAAVARAAETKTDRPNLLIIHTDEHNFRTLGCYRALMSDDQAYVWGAGVKVDTPHIDSLARDGAICTSYYAASPVCTPSRASFISGLYPIATGSPSNNLPMHDGLVTFAEVLGKEGYATSYLGKWHLDGEDKPGFEPPRRFGFADNRYMFNRGHWKSLTMKDGKPALLGQFNPKSKGLKYDVRKTDAESFTTDFLTNRTLETLKRDQEKPFCIMLSIPDPHTPNTVRPPYDTMFKDLHFEHPRTMEVPLETMPRWAISNKQIVTSLDQTKMQGYFGMVKCIDDNVGRILKFLKDNKLEQNTIVVFTSDHGDTMGEHKRHNKGVPYETSAKIPFVIRYPGRIKPGKVIHTAYTTVDFSPTILGMMGAPQIPDSVGLDDSAAFLDDRQEAAGDRIVYLTNSASNWVAALDKRHKLVLSVSDTPWLFDLERDPDELQNFYDNPEYGPVAKKLQAELIRQMKLYNEPALSKGREFLYSSEQTPASDPAKTNGVLKANAKPGAEFLIEAAGLECDASSAKPKSWNRALEVPAKSFQPNRRYQLTLAWTSRGLGDGSTFYATFTSRKDRKKGRQSKTWTAESGKSGVVNMELVTDERPDWQFIAGINGPGHLRVDRIQIAK